MYALTLDPLRRDPHLTESVLSRLKLSLGVMFENPSAARYLLIVVRELLDNLVAYTDWEQSPGPSLSIRYAEHSDAQAFLVSTTNVAKDVEHSARAAAEINGYLRDASEAPLKRRLSERLIESEDIDSSGGIGLLQVASLPGCRLEVRLRGSTFCVRAKLTVSELRPASAPLAL